MKKCRGRATVDHLEWSRAQCGLEGGVVAILGPRQPIQPHTRTVAGDAAQIHGDRLVHRLRLANRFGDERRCSSVLDTCKTEQVGPYIAGEDGITVISAVHHQHASISIYVTNLYRQNPLRVING